MTVAQYKDLDVQKDQKLTDLFERCKVFFAFTDQQFEEGKTKLDAGDKYVSIKHGGLCPFSKVEELKKGFAEIREWFSNQVIALGLEESEIEYQLCNYECYYTWSIDDAMEAMNHKYSAERVWAVFHKNKDKHTDY